jgi:ribosomal protein S6--L-glutamate ligase
VKLCFLVEEPYRYDGMPLDVVHRLTAWGHHVDVVWPGRSLLRLSDGIQAGTHDAWVLKTVSGGPGLSLLEAAAAVGLTTVNDVRSIRPVRDKTLAAVIAARHGLPVPTTYTALHREDLAEIPAAEFPLVVKPADGSSGRAVQLVSAPEQLLAPAGGDGGQGAGPFVAQPYIPNPGHDLKAYCVAGEVHATVRRSPLHPEQSVTEGEAALSAEVAWLVQQVGAVYGLDLFGVDIVLGPDGPVIVDVNDFPSFRGVPDAVDRVSRAVLRLARAGGGLETRPPGAAEVLLPAGGPGR